MSRFLCCKLFREMVPGRDIIVVGDRHHHGVGRSFC
jgi:hypothetical protein